MSAEFRRTIKTPEQVQADREKRERKQQDLQEKNNEKEAEKAAIKASWERISGEEAVDNLLHFLATRREMLVNVSVSGIGYVAKPGTDKGDIEQIRMTSEQRLANMDRAAGIDEAVAFIERHLQHS